MVKQAWLKNYPIRWNLDYPEISLYEYLKQTTTAYPDLIALVYFGNEITFLEMQQNIDRVAGALVDMGVKKGDRVALMLPNCPEYVYVYYACMKLGAILIQLNPLYTPNELEPLLKDSGAKMFFGVDGGFSSFNAVRGRVLVEYSIVVRLVWNDVEGDNLWFDDLLQKYPPKSPEGRISPKDDAAVLQYTGGGTGQSKAVILTHFNLIANVIQTKESIRDWIDKSFAGGVVQKFTLAVIPFFHTYGMTWVMNVGLTVPTGLIMLPRFEADSLLELIDQYRPNIFLGVPAIYTAIANHPYVDKYNLDCIELCNSGGASTLSADVRAFFEKTGSKLMAGYGLTEASPVTHSSWFATMHKPGSVGLPYPDTDCRIVDTETGTKDLPPGEEGELIIKGPQVMKGYWNRPEDTAETIRDGWLYTGDIARMDEDGYFYIITRKKDVVTTGGLPIHPHEVDKILIEHSKVSEAVTAGIPDQYYGEILKAYVVLKDGESATQEELLEYCSHKLASFKVPRCVEFRNELPKSASVKTLRRILVEEEKNKAAQDKV